VNCSVKRNPSGNRYVLDKAAILDKKAPAFWRQFDKVANSSFAPGIIVDVWRYRLAAHFMESRDDIVESLLSHMSSKHFMLFGPFSLEVVERISVANVPRDHEFANLLHHYRVFVGIDALPKVIFDLQRPVVLDKERS
jgi:hypothetical protein